MLNASKKETECWDLYRADGRFEKIIPNKGYDIPDDMYHMTVEVIPTDKAGHLLITQRAFTKKIGPGKLEFPAGSVISGESPVVAARRELQEETGLKAVKMFKLGEYKIPKLQRTIYLAHIPDLKTAEVKLQEGETVAYAVVSFKKWLEYVAEERFETSKLRYYPENLLRKLEAEVGEAEDEQSVPVQPQIEKVSDDIFAIYRKKIPSAEETIKLPFMAETVENELTGSNWYEINCTSMMGY